MRAAVMRRKNDNVRFGNVLEDLREHLRSAVHILACTLYSSMRLSSKHERKLIYKHRYSPDNVKTMQQEDICQESEKTTTTTEVTPRTTTSSLLDFSPFEARCCEEMKCLEDQIDLIERHFIEGRMQVNDVASNDFAKSLEHYCDEQYEAVCDLMKRCINIAPVMKRRVQRDRDTRMNLMEKKIEPIGAHLLATHAALTSLPVDMNVTQDPLKDVERLLLTTDKFVHMLSMPLDLSAHHKFEHACSHMKEKISRHCENVERRCSSYETFLDSVLRRQKKAQEQTKEIESRLKSEWKQLKRSYAPLLTPLRVRKEHAALIRSLKTSLNCSSEETLQEGMRMRRAKFSEFMKTIKRCKKSSTFLVRHLKSRMIQRGMKECANITKKDV